MIDLPRELPEKPEGWGKQMIQHLNMGSNGHVGTFSITDATGKEMPFTYAYRTGREPFSGFFFYGSNECLTWAELRKRWPQYVKTRERMEKAGKLARELSDAAALSMVVIYDHPKDHPNGFVVRSWDVFPGRAAPNQILGKDLPTLEDARKLVPSGMANIGRTEEDDAKIVEVWL